MNEHQQQLVEYLKQWVTLRRQMHNGHDWAYLCMEDFLIREGRWYKPQPLPEVYHFGKIKQCFNNSYALACEMTPDVRYVEGIAASIIPVHHAWLTDRQGNVIDVTLREPASAYIGIEVPIAKAHAALAREMTVLDDWRSHQHIFHKPFRQYYRNLYGSEIDR
jgi:hypothetical protein